MAIAPDQKKGAPFSIRLRKETERYVEAEARRTRRSKSAIVQDLAEEAARMRLFPGILFREASDGTREARIAGYRVWLAIQLLQDVDSFDQMVEWGSMTREQLELAQAYYQRYPEEIDQAIAENRAAARAEMERNPDAVVYY